MNAETLNKANSIRCEMAVVEKILKVAEIDQAVDISFNVGGFGCTSCQHPFLSPEEVADIKSNITELIRTRAITRLDELQKEFENL